MTHTAKATAAAFLGLATFTILTPSTARADERLVATVPFEFTVGDTQMPAGGYIVTRTTDNPEVMTVSSMGGQHFTFVLTIPESEAVEQPPELIFEQVNGRNHLAQVVLPGGDRFDVIIPHESGPDEARNANSSRSRS